MEFSPEEYYNLALEAFQNNNFHIAKDLLQKCIKANPSDHEAFTLLAGCFEKEGELGEAALAFKKALEIRPDIAEYHYNYGLGLTWIGRIEEGRKKMQDFIRLAPQHSLIEKAKRFIRDEDFLKNLKSDDLTLEEQLRLKATFEKAKELMFQEQYAQARALYEEVLRNKPNHKASLNDLGLCYTDLEKYEDALSCFNRILEMDREDILALINRAKVYNKLERYSEAEADIKIIATLKPVFYRDCIRMAVELGRLRRDKLALRLFREGFRMCKDDPDLYYYWGIALANNGEYEEAFAKWSLIDDLEYPKLKEYIRKVNELKQGDIQSYCFEYEHR